MFSTYRLSNSIVYASNQYKDRSLSDKKKLLTTKKRLQTALCIKIEKVKSYIECDPFEYKLSASCTQMWDEIEELSSALHDIKVKLKYYDNQNVIDNTNMLNDYYNKNLNKDSLEL
tara:strand:+ start:457 stop:804 length:348 start_codon:yes stop_codon:yes gene_type:complete